MIPRVKELSDLILEKSSKESNFHPVDRFFLQPYIEEILKLDKIDFLLYNLEQVNITYSACLMLCLPELWDDITIDDIIELTTMFTNSFSYYSLIYFVYRYIEIDILEMFELFTLSYEMRADLTTYIKSQYPNFLKDDSDYLFFQENAYGIQNEEWMYIKQKLLLDKRVRPALRSLSELKDYVDGFQLI